MKKIISICIVGILLCTAFGAVALASDVKTQDDTNKGNRDYTHTIFAEDGTATWCGYCHYAREALDKIYTSGAYPFYYVCLVDDKNTHAAARINDFNLAGFPTVFFDYGYKVVVGGWTGAEAAYKTAITQCGARAVADIDINLNVEWLGDAAMDISIGVTNNEAAPYVGHLHVYVCEIESSLNWKDTTGHPYTFPFLDYAFNEGITIPVGETWTNEKEWDGHDYNSGMGQTYDTIQYGNIAVIAAVFNNTMHQGYSDPPSGGPFNAYWVDEAAGFLVADTGPNTPSNPSPANGATNVALTVKPSWTGGGSPGLTITYDVYFGTASSPPKVASNQSATTYNPGTLSYSTKYYWKIVAWDQSGNSKAGPIWYFTTLSNPNAPPNLPTISGPNKGEPGKIYKYTVTATDSDQDPIYGYIDWNDSTTTEWVGPYNSGEAFFVTHSWAEKGTYTVKVKVRDEHGAESDWATLDVKMPTSFDIANPFLHWLFERFPNAFPILRHLMGY
jgi:glutaredoxin